MRIDKDLVAASATPLVLGILADGDLYGYAILKRVSELSGGGMQWTDGMLYLWVGDSGDPASSLDLGSNNGKVLRMTPAGRPAPGNPFGNSLVWAFGLRNSLGMDFDPQRTRLCGLTASTVS